MKSASPLLEKLLEINKELQRNSICHSCGRPRECFFAPMGGRVVHAVDDSGSLITEHIGTLSTPKPSAYGYCSCEYVYFYAVDGDRLLKEHRAHGGIFKGYEPSPGGVSALLLDVASSEASIRVTTDDFNCPVYCRIYAESAPGGCIKVALIAQSKREVA